MSISGLSSGLGLGGTQTLNPYQSLYANPQAGALGQQSPLGGVGGTTALNGLSGANPLGQTGASGLGGNSIQGLGDGSMATILQAIITMLTMILSMLTGGQAGTQPGASGNSPGSAGSAGNAGNAGNTGNAGTSGAPAAENTPSPSPSPGSSPSGGGDGIPSSNGSGVPDDQDENGKTAAQENTTGPAGAVSDAEIAKAAGGDPVIEKQLKRLNTDVEGHKELRLALDKGTTYHQGNLPGNEIGLTETGSGHGPVITLKSTGMDTVAHETAHAAYQDMSHAEVYRLGHRVEGRLGK